MSPIGLGSHLGTFSDEDSNAYVDATAYVVKNGINVIDTAINYRGMRSEKDIGFALKKLIDSEEIEREELIISSKAGLLFGDITKGIKPTDYLNKELVKFDITMDDFHIYHGLYQTLKPEFFEVALAISLDNLGLETIDIHYIHIPEISRAGLSEEEFYSQLELLIKWYEKKVQAEKIRYYGLALEMLCMEPEEKKWYIDLDKIVTIANEISKGNSHFRFIQLPYNQKYNSAAINKNQSIKGEYDTLLNVAKRLGLQVVGSMPFAMGDGFKEATISNMMGFCLGQKDIACVNCGSKNIDHIQEIIDVSRKLLKSSQ